MTDKEKILLVVGLLLYMLSQYRRTEVSTKILGYNELDYQRPIDGLPDYNLAIWNGD